MTKKEIIKYLDYNDYLFKTTENENSLGELMLTEMQFIKADKIIEKLENTLTIREKQINKLKDLISNKNEKFSVISGTITGNVIRFTNTILVLPQSIVSYNTLINEGNKENMIEEL